MIISLNCLNIPELKICHLTYILNVDIDVDKFVIFGLYSIFSRTVKTHSASNMSIELLSRNRPRNDSLAAPNSNGMDAIHDNLVYQINYNCIGLQDWENTTSDLINLLLNGHQDLSFQDNINLLDQYKCILKTQYIYLKTIYIKNTGKFLIFIQSEYSIIIY